jgi:hypothetical protein
MASSFLKTKTAVAGTRRTTATGGPRLTEAVEAKPGRRTDQQVRRIPDQGGRPADIGCQDLADEDRKGRDPEHAGDIEGHGHEQDDRRDIREDGRQDSRDEAQDDQDADGPATSQLDGPDRDELEEARSPEDLGEDHHPASRKMTLRSIPRRPVLVDDLQRIIESPPSRAASVLSIRSVAISR